MNRTVSSLVLSIFMMQCSLWGVVVFDTDQKAGNTKDQFIKQLIQRRIKEKKPVPYKLQATGLVATGNRAHKKPNAKKIAYKVSSKHDHPSCCKEVHKILQKDVGRHGFTINKPGFYCLAEDVTFNPDENNQVAISIESDNVNLSLSGHTLSQSSSSFDQFDNISAIFIQSGFNFVTVKDGQIVGFSDNGVVALSDNLEPTDHTGIVYEDLIVRDCGKLTTNGTFGAFQSRFGLGVLAGTDILFKRNFVIGCKSSQNLVAQGVEFGDNVVNDSPTCERNQIAASEDPNSNSLVLVETVFCDNVSVTNARIFDNHAELPVNQAFLGITSIMLGIEIDLSNNSTVENCEVSDNTAFGFVGIQAVDVNNVSIDSCRMRSNTAESLLQGITAGASADTAFNISISNCSIEEFILQRTVGPFANNAYQLHANFLVRTTNGTYTNCISSGHRVLSSVPSGTILVRTYDSFSNAFGCTNLTYENCIALDVQTAPGTTGFGYVQGFNSEVFSSEIVYKNCTASGQFSDDPATVVVGFSTALVRFDSADIMYDSCIAENNTNGANPTNGFGFIIGFGGGPYGSQGSSILNCISNRNGVGIQLDGSPTTGCLVQGNTLLSNTQIGINDITGNTTNAYVANFSYNPGGINFAGGFPGGNPIRLWNKSAGSLPGAPVAGEMDNLDVT